MRSSPSSAAARRPATPASGAVARDLNGAGLRATKARAAVLGALREARGPRSHGEVADALARSGLDRATVYRNLLDLTRAGLARRTDLGDHVWRFEATARDRRHAAHFLCRACGAVSCLDGLSVGLPRGTRAPRAVRGGDIEIRVTGLCDACGA